MKARISVLRMRGGGVDKQEAEDQQSNYRGRWTNSRTKEHQGQLIDSSKESKPEIIVEG